MSKNCWRCGRREDLTEGLVEKIREGRKLLMCEDKDDCTHWIIDVPAFEVEDTPHLEYPWWRNP